MSDDITDNNDTKSADRISKSLTSDIPLRLMMGIVIVGLLIATYWLLAKTGVLDVLLDGNALRQHVAELGPFGPLVVIGLMTTAIVVNPIPSAPIALAAGAAYGHTWGTVYVLVGAETGALIAFGIARLLGCEIFPKLCNARESLRLLGSQNTLMAIVFASRLMPFISFDLVSYAAGLTALSTWRFALATFAGILPASFLLAHFGAEMTTANPRRIMLSVAALGALILIPIAIRAWIVRRQRSTVNKR
jgi:uncharacterized membrane protein YdjX (TVP38/TMEM64 family)